MTSLTKRPGSRPLSGPARAVATSLPGGSLSGVWADTALLPSTAPALRAKSTAATAVPDRATTRAMIATTIAGDGLLRHMTHLRERPGHRARGPSAGRYPPAPTPAARPGAKPSGPGPSLTGCHVP